MAKSKAFFVYMLVDPRDGRPYYIGETLDKKTRYRYHCENSGRNTAVARHNQAIIRAGKRPFMVELDQADNEVEALRKELFWIDLLMARGVELANRENQGWLYERFNEQVTVARIEKPRAPKHREQGGAKKRHGLRWSQKETEQLLNRYQESYATLLAELAEEHGRGRRAIEMQLKKLIQ